MKNAMKKLMSVLLVAVLLISAVPFAAFADGESTANGQVEITVNLTFNDGSATQSYRKSIPVGTTVAGVLNNCMGEASANALMAKYKRNVGNYGDVAVFEETTVLDLAFEINTNAVNVKLYADTTTEGNIYNLPYGTVLNLGSDILSRAGLSLPADRAIDYIKVNGVQSTASSITVTSYTTVEVYTKIVGSNNSSINNGSSNNNTTTTTRKDITVNVKNVEGGAVVWTKTITPSGATAKVSDILYYHYGNRSNDWMNNYTCTKAYSSFIGGDVGYNGVVSEGDTLTIVLTAKSSNNTNNSNTNNSGISTKDNTNQVWLHVYTNGNASTINKSINLTGTYLMDDNATNTTEILNYLLTNYYKSSDSSKNVELDGLYVNLGSSGTFPQNYYTDNKTDSVSEISTKLANGYIHINVMLKNVTAKTTTTSTADSSNPKTGDSIYTAMTVMGISAATLAAVMYVYTKKRQAI